MGYRGHIAFAGAVSGGNPDISVITLLSKGLSASAVYVGSHADFEALLGFMEEHEIHPHIDRTFTFDEMHEAYDFMENGSYTGKIVVTM